VAGGVPMAVRTLLGREIIRALANLNDQFCTFLFLEFQFFEEFKRLGASEARLYTDQVFEKNPFSSQIHVRIDKLHPHLEANRGVSFGAYLAASYEFASTFSDRAIGLLRQTNLALLPLSKGNFEAPEAYYRRTLSANGYSLPAKELSDTLAFIRYRRNGIVHLSVTPKSKYENFTRQLGPALNLYWRNSHVKLDFAKPQVGPPSEQYTFDLLKLLRIVTQQLDRHLATLLDVQSLVNFEAKRMFGEDKTRFNLLFRNKQMLKLANLLKREYGIEPSDTALSKAIRLAATV
jgi:hypothetical protein